MAGVCKSWSYVDGVIGCCGKATQSVGGYCGQGCCG